MRKIYLFIIFLFSTSTIYAQESIEDQVSFLKALRMRMINAQDEELLALQNDTFRIAIRNFLNTDRSFFTQLDSVSFIGDLYAPDNSFRIINWNIPKGEGFYAYYAFIQTHDKKEKATTVFELHDGKSNLNSPEYKTLDADSWYGALYYEIIPNKTKKRTEYILLGWDGASPMLNSKIIDILYFNGRGEPKFGVTHFKLNRRMQRRVIFKYAEDAFMSLRYHPKKEMIVFDHLVPMKDGMDGIYEFYGPDFTYDAFKQKRDGSWEFVEQIDIRQEKNNKNWNSPTRKNLPASSSESNRE